MGCGCGKRTARRPASLARTTQSGQTTTTGGKTGAAQTYQSATTLKAPKGPVTSRTTV